MPFGVYLRRLLEELVPPNLPTVRLWEIPLPTFGHKKRGSNLLSITVANLLILRNFALPQLEINL